LLCDPTDPERAFVSFESPDDSVALLINNYGGLSTLELGALTDETIRQLGMIVYIRDKCVVLTQRAESRWRIKPSRIFSGVFETSLNAPGFSISLCNITKAAQDSNSKVSELLDLLDLKTSAVSWPNTTTTPAVNGTNGLNGSLMTGDTSLTNGAVSNKKNLEGDIIGMGS
jgi:triose/dihydroxyacetone kinase / FAD-AMP lyase (cyclizing)